MRYFPIVALGVALLAAPIYLARDLWLAHLVEEVIHHQAEVKIDHDISILDLHLDSDLGRLNLEQIALTPLSDPQKLQALAAEEVDLDVEVIGFFSRHVRVKHARVYDADVVLEYIAPGVSNFKIMEQTFRSYVEQRKAEGKSRLLEWDLDQLDLYRVHFTLIDYSGQVLADVQIPKISVSTLSTRNSGKENFALLMGQIQKSVLEETIKGRVQGKYDVAGLLQLVRRELPHMAVFESAPVNKLKEAGKKFLKGWLQK